MADREVVGRLVRDREIGVDERSILIADNIGIRLIFHYDEKNIIELSEFGRLGRIDDADPHPQSCRGHNRE